MDTFISAFPPGICYRNPSSTYRYVYVGVLQSGTHVMVHYQQWAGGQWIFLTTRQMQELVAFPHTFITVSEFLAMRLMFHHHFRDIYMQHSGTHA